MQHRSAKEIAREWALIALGAASYAVGYSFFFYPNGIVPGGVTGIATIVNYLTGAPVGVVSMVINLPLFAFGWRHFGRRFILFSFAATVLIYAFVDSFALLDAAAAEVVDKYLYYLSEAMLNFCNIFRPQVIILGGGVCAQGEKLIRPLKRKVNSLAYGGVKYAPVQIVTASLGNDAGLCGAARLAMLR